MSFPFLQSYTGLSNSLQTAQAGGAGGVGGWVELARTTLGSAGDVIDVTSLPDKRYYMILKAEIASGQIYGQGTFNGDTGNNYASRYEDNGGADGTQTTHNDMVHNINAHTNGYSWQVGYVANRSASEKLCIFECTANGGAGASNAPNRRSAVNKWSNTSNAINQYTSTNGGTGSFDTGSEIIVCGWDPGDSHTSNFFEELASVELGSSGDQLSTGSFSAKKYLWMQIALKNTGGDINMKLTCNNDTGTNYSRRWTNNGSGNNNSTSESNVQLNSGNNFQFYNIFMINNSANEKLGIVHSVDISSAGAATAPIRSERVFKWANTAAQITEIDIDNTAAGSFDTGSIIKVWGAD